MYLRSFDIIIVSSLFFKNPIKIKQLCSLMQDLFVDEDHNELFGVTQANGKIDVISTMS